MISVFQSIFNRKPVAPKSVAQITSQFHAMTEQLSELESTKLQLVEELGEEMNLLAKEVEAANQEAHLAGKVSMKILSILN